MLSQVFFIDLGQRKDRRGAAYIYSVPSVPSNMYLYTLYRVYNISAFSLKLYFLYSGLMYAGLGTSLKMHSNPHRDRDYTFFSTWDKRFLTWDTLREAK